jgi:serine/threonine-protein kinase HipA
LTVSEAYVHARFADGSSRLVGLYQLVTPQGAAAFGRFSYVGSWRRNEHGRAFPLDPENLPLAPGPFEARRRERLPGPLADTTPDRWGRRVVEATRPAARPPLSPADWLFVTGDERVGCLAFSATSDPPAASEGFAGAADLAELGEQFERLDRGEAADANAARFFQAGRSLGGARPKAAIALDGALWIAKFQRRDDEYDQCAAEHATMRLAAACGIETAETRLRDVGPRRVVLVRRFDRTAGPPFRPTAHYVSALSLLDLDETSDAGSYLDIAGFLHRISARHRQDREELFRRMVFNVLSGNRDDHLKNHAVLCDASGWRLSPAFDIVPQPDFEPMQAIGVGASGAYPSIANCLSRCGEFGLDAAPARGIVDRMIETMKPWRRMFSEDGVPDATVRRLERAFAKSLGEDCEPVTPSPRGR